MIPITLLCAESLHELPRVGLFTELPRKRRLKNFACTT
jgi:hypothetical protein